MPRKIEVSYKTIVFTIIFLLFLFLLYQIKDIIFLVFVAFILMSALKPWTDYLEKFHIPKTLSVLLVYLFFIAFLAFIGSSVVPPLINQSVRLVENFPYYIATYFPFVQIDMQFLVQQIAPLSQNLVKATFGVFNNIITLFAILVISFYLIIERKNIEPHLSNFMGEEAAKRVLIIVKKVERRLSIWLRGQLTLMLIVGTLTFLGLTILDLPYVLPLAIIAGVLEIIPTIGPIISAIPAVLVSLTISPLFAAGVALLYFLIQQLENQLIVPIVMKKAVGIAPLVTLISLLIGARLAGLVGAILAIPIVVTIEAIASEYFKLKDIQ